MLNWKIPFIVGVLLIVGVNAYFFLTENLVSVPEGDVVYFWDFGDGTTSVNTNPTHTYGKEGRYKVKLTMRNGTNVSSKSFMVDATQGMKYQPNVIPIQIEGFSVPE